MPTYEYACKACDHRFEIVQSFSEDALTTCPDCEQDALRKVYNAAGIIFKGDGWHIKDYGSSGAAPAASGTSDAASDSSSESSSDSSSDAASDSSTKASKAPKSKRSSGEGTGGAANRPAAS